MVRAGHPRDLFVNLSASYEDERFFPMSRTSRLEWFQQYPSVGYTTSLFDHAGQINLSE
jgi:hypothetical protein